MNIKRTLFTLTSLALVLGLLGCNLPSTKDEATKAPADVESRPTQLPTNTSPPPTATFTQLPPTETPTELPPTATLPPLPTPIPATPTRRPSPTAESIVPESRARFVGTFSDGELTFRIGENSATVVLKTASVKQAPCKEGGQISDTLTFDSPTYFQIIQGAFSIVYDIVTVSGRFTTPTRANGSITLKLRKSGANCTVGPLGWTANAVP